MARGLVDDEILPLETLDLEGDAVATACAPSRRR